MQFWYKLLEPTHGELFQRHTMLGTSGELLKISNENWNKKLFDMPLVAVENLCFPVPRVHTRTAYLFVSNEISGFNFGPLRLCINQSGNE